MASMSKRAQARTERELHDLLRTPGNQTCADCGARNPAWASWNLGVFLCVRCASIHRKLGTHISKVKSISMDTWTNEQVESMKKNGNLAVNKLYNPKNKRPDIPLDADEVDGAMERFIRKKYQEKSLLDGKPEVPRRDKIPPTRSKSPEPPSPPALPAKKGRFFGFGLRASSSAYPLSKHDKKHRNEPRVDNAFRISSENFSTGDKVNSNRAEISNYDIQVKLVQLRDMGFSDHDRNINLLKRNNGDIERTIAALVKLGANDQITARRAAPPAAVPTGGDALFPAMPEQTSASAPQSAKISNNPFEQTNQSTNAGLFPSDTVSRTTATPTDSWQTPQTNLSSTGLEQSFSNMQVSQPLFPHSTGGHPGQPLYSTQNALPPIPAIPQQYAAVNSPISTSNPFIQAPLSVHSTGSNPYSSYMQNVSSFAPATNPFLNIPTSSNVPSTNVPAQHYNPFGLPPPQSIPSGTQPNTYNAQPTFALPGSQFHSGMETPTQPPPPPPPQQQHYSSFNVSQSPPPLPDHRYTQSPVQQFQQQQQAQQQSMTATQPQRNPYLQQPLLMQQPLLQNPTYQQQLPPGQPLIAQPTGHMDKGSILALYNFPQLAPNKPLASIPEPNEDPSQPQNVPHQPVSPAPMGEIYGSANGLNPGKRSATMPASSMHSAGGAGSRNPFMMNNTAGGVTSASMSGQGTRHTSHDSMIVNNPVLQNGRHSPDAFANLSARYMTSTL